MSKIVSQTKSLTAQPSGYDSTSGTLSDQTNGYNSSSNTTYATITASKSSTAYIYYTFDLSSIPSDATINSVSCVVKYKCSSTSSTTASVQLYTGTTAKGSATTTVSTTATTYNLTCGTWTRTELDDLQLYVSVKNSSTKNTKAIWFYGADLTISYTYNEIVYVVTISSSGDGSVSPTGEQEVSSNDNLDITLTPDATVTSTTITDNDTDVTSQLSSNVYSLTNVTADHTINVIFSSVTYSVTSTITNGTITSPTDNPVSVAEGKSVTINFTGDTDKIFKYMKVNGEEVTPTATTAQEGQDSTTATYTYSTNYGVYSTYYLSQAFDGSTSDYFWSSEAQSEGKYILITFNKFINLTAFSTYSSDSTDYPHSCNELQCSADGNEWTTLGTFSDSQTTTFSNLSTGNIKYIRIYSTSSDVTNWLVLNTVTMTYTTPELDATIDGYTYTISNITSDNTVEIRFAGLDSVYMKIASGWKAATAAYKKTSSGWEEIEPSEFYTLIKNKKIIIKK